MSFRSGTSDTHVSFKWKTRTGIFDLVKQEINHIDFKEKANAWGGNCSSLFVRIVHDGENLLDTQHEKNRA